MSIDFLKRVALFVAFVLAQALVLGRIHLFHCATPLLYVYFITLFPRNYPKWGVLTWAFVMGLQLPYNLIFMHSSYPAMQQRPWSRRSSIWDQPSTAIML